MEPARRVRDALLEGELELADLTARQLGAFLGKTTSVLYHHFGSLEGFLFAVGQEGFALLGERLAAGLARGGAAEAAACFVAFGLDCPALYHLMLGRPYDWKALRAAGALEGPMPGLQLWGAIATRLGAEGAVDPVEDTRLLVAGLHGLVSLAATGRANFRRLDRSDREVALQSARALVSRLTRKTKEPRR